MPSYEDVKKTSVTVLLSTADKLKAMAGQMGYDLERPVYMAEVVRELVKFYEEHDGSSVPEEDPLARFKELNPHLRLAGDPVFTTKPTNTPGVSVSVIVPDPAVEDVSEPEADTVEVEPEQADVTEEMTVQKYEPAPEVEPEEKPAPPKWTPGAKFGNPIR